MKNMLMGKERSMISGVGLGQEFWVEVVEIACYLVNKSPSSMLEDNIIHMNCGLVRNPLFHI